MNARDLPGFGDEATWGPVGGPNDPRCEDDTDALAVIAAHIFDERMTSPVWIDDAFSELAHEDYKRAAAELAAGNPHRTGELLRDAVARIVKAGAEKEARIRLDRMRAEDEADAAATRMEH